MAISFRIISHSLKPGVEVAEILEDGVMIGTIYPAGPKSIKLVSAHIASSKVDEGFAGNVVVDDGTTVWPPIPSINVIFDPQPYTIDGGRLIKLTS